MNFVAVLLQQSIDCIATEKLFAKFREKEKVGHRDERPGCAMVKILAGLIYAICIFLLELFQGLLPKPLVA